MVQLCRAQARRARPPGPSALDRFCLRNWGGCPAASTALGLVYGCVCRPPPPLRLQQPGHAWGRGLVALQGRLSSDSLFLRRRGVLKNLLLVLGWQRGLQWVSCCRGPGAVPSTGAWGHESWVCSAFSSKVLPIPASPVSYRHGSNTKTPWFMLFASDTG